MGRDMGEDTQVLVEMCHLVPGASARNLRSDVIFLGEAETAMRLCRQVSAACQDASDASSFAMFASVPQGRPLEHRSRLIDHHDAACVST